MKFVFFGTDDFSVTVLDELKSAGFLPSLIITVPDKPRGRGLRLSPSHAKQWAEKNKITVSFDCSSLTDDYQLFVVASFGKIIPKAMLDIPKYGALNVHPSLLPKYRGASPIESQILADEKEVGVTIILMDEQMDHGPILAQRKIETRLRKVFAEEGGKLLVETLQKWLAGKIEPKPQDETRATYTKKLVKTDGEINLNDDSYKNFLKIQAFQGSIGTYFLRKNIRVIIKDAEFEDGKLIISRVIPEGKKEMPYHDFLRGL